jgi:hypothetical protein
LHFNEHFCCKCISHQLTQNYMYTAVIVLQTVRTGDSATAAAAAHTAAAAAAVAVAAADSSGGAAPSNSEAASSTLRNKVLLELTRRNWPMLTVQPLTVTRRRELLLAFLRRSHSLDTASATGTANDDSSGNSSDSSRPGTATTAGVADTDLTFLTGLEQFADSASAEEQDQFDELQHGELQDGDDVAGDSPTDGATAVSEGLLLFPAMVEAIVQCEACSCALYLQVM